MVIFGRMALRACTVSFFGPTGAHHSVSVTAESLYEAAGLGLSLLRRDGWVDQIAPGAQLEVTVSEPVITHRVTLLQIRRWCDGIAVSPDETLKKSKLKALIG